MTDGQFLDLLFAGIIAGKPMSEQQVAEATAELAAWVTEQVLIAAWLPKVEQLQPKGLLRGGVIQLSATIDIDDIRPLVRRETLVQTVRSLITGLGLAAGSFLAKGCCVAFSVHRSAFMLHVDAAVEIFPSPKDPK